MADIHELLEPLKTARRLEEEGRKFFAEAARTTKSRLAQQTFKFLVQEENRHLRTIDAYIANLTASEKLSFPSLTASKVDEVIEDFRALIATLYETYTPDMTDIEAYRMALNFENGAEEFYRKKLRETDHPDVKKLYEWLIAEETMHARLLQACLNFVEDPEGWFKRHRPER